MKKLLIYHLFLFCSFISFSQVLLNNDTLNSNLAVKFNKVRQSFKEANTSTMYISYLTKSKEVLLTFDVPSFNFRLNTSLYDYCIIESKAEKVTLQNRIEGYAKGKDLNIYGFTFVISKDSLIKILSPNLKRITFYFTPNENKIKDYLGKNIYMRDELKKYLIKLSRKIIKYTISKPDEVQYSELISWLKKR